MDLKEQLKSLSAQDRKELLKQLQQEEKENKRNRRDAYEGLRAQFMLEVKNKLLPVVDDVKAFRDWVEKEAAAFRAVMREYGQLRKDEQASFTIVDGDMKLEVRSNKVKSFDERADLAAERLVDYLKRYAMGRELGTDDLRAQFMLEVKNKLLPVVDDVKAFRDWVEKEAAAFRAVMREYGQLRKDEQASFTIVDGDMKLEVRSNKVKSFDERADLAAERLVDYLKRYAMGRELGTDDPMYQLGMTMIERNRQGDLDYKSVSKLYELEDRFDSEYTEIMDLFRESNVVYKTAVNYYFHKRDENGVWHRIEPSFCRL